MPPVEMMPQRSGLEVEGDMVGESGVARGDRVGVASGVWADAKRIVYSGITSLVVVVAVG
jgi:hypothetical protein